jgi:hypothetical protein
MAKLKRYLILPKSKIPLKKQKLFYLAGPVEGGGGWQKKAISILRKDFPEAYFAFRCPFNEMRRLRRFALKGEEEQYSSEAEWRRDQMEFAAMSGCLMFWLGPQDKEEEADFTKIPYGLIASREEAVWAFRLFYNNKLRVVIGVHHSFPGHDEIVENLLDLFGANFHVYNRLPDLLEAAALRAKK